MCNVHAVFDWGKMKKNVMNDVHYTILMSENQGIKLKKKTIEIPTHIFFPSKLNYCIHPFIFSSFIKILYN